MNIPEMTNIFLLKTLSTEKTNSWRIRCYRERIISGANPFECIFSSMEIASIAIQATISTDILHNKGMVL
jgi:hypothetical protein